jgi:predicted permease
MRSLRILRFNPTFAAAALLTLALGIGANTAVFSVVNGVLLSPLSYPDSERLVSVLTSAPGAPNPNGGTSGIPDLPEPASMYVTYRDENRSFDAIGIWSAFAATVTGMGEPEQVRTVNVGPGVLETLAVQPVLGRWLAASDYQPGRPGDVLISHGYWQRRFGGDPSVVGRSITIDSRPRAIVGVMPQGFRVANTEPELIAPIGLDRSQMFLVPFNFQTVARLKSGVTIAEANADLRRLAPVWLNTWSMPPGLGGNPRGFESWRIVSTVRPLKEEVIGTVGNVLWVLMGTIGIVMLIACANVANLLLVRAEGRQQELAIRAALGAGWWRIVRELLVESLWLGFMGGALGLAIAYGAVRLLVTLGPTTLPRLDEISINAPVLAFAFLVSLLSGLLFGTIPAFKYAGRRFSGALMGSRTATHGRERHRTRNGLVVIQVALALVMLVSSGLMIRTFQAMRAVKPGFAVPEQLQTLRVVIRGSAADTPERVVQTQKQILDALAAVPGATSAALSSAMPLEGMLPNPILSSRSPFRAETDANDVAQTRPLRWFKFISPGFFRTSGTRIIAGREYEWLDLERLRPVAMVSENLAIELWGSASAALGKRVRGSPIGPWREVIGVVEDVRENGVHAAAPPIVYWPSMLENLFQAGQADVIRSATFVVRSPRAGTEGLVDAARRAVWSVNSNLPVALVRTMEDVYAQSMARTSFTLVMLAIAAAMALVLGIVGIYAVIAYAVAQRTREIGIRVALGAQHGEVRRMFVRYGLVLASVGVAIGLGVAASLTRFMTSLLFEVSPLDPITYVAVSMVLITTALLAAYLPARRASLVDPTVSLRAQ